MVFRQKKPEVIGMWREPVLMTQRNPIASKTFTAVLAAVLISPLASAQFSRISRTDVETRNQLPSGDLGAAEIRRGPGLFGSQRRPNLAQVDRRQLSSLISQLQSEIGRLASALEADYRRDTRLRPLLIELIAVREQLRQLAVPATAQQGDLADVMNYFLQTDASWQIFSNRLGQARQLSEPTVQSLARANSLDRQIGRLFQVDPTLDRPALLQQLSGQETALHFLTDELQRDVNASSSLITSCRKLEQQVNRVASMVVENLSYERLVSEYVRFEESWAELMPQLTQLNNNYVDRNIQRITQEGYRIHDLLWLENTVSNAVLLQLTDSLVQAVDEFYRRTSLMLLMDVGSVDATMNVASDFYGTVQNLQDNLQRGESESEVIDSFRYVEEYERAFLQTFGQIRSQAARVVLQQISDGVEALRRELGLGNSSIVNATGLRPIVASLENLADQLDMDVRLWLNSEQPAWRNEVSAASLTFVRGTQRLHRLTDTETRLQPMTQEVDGIYENWKILYGFLSRCRTPERAALAWRARLINETLADLDRQLRP